MNWLTIPSGPDRRPHQQGPDESSMGFRDRAYFSTSGPKGARSSPGPTGGNRSIRVGGIMGNGADKALGPVEVSLYETLAPCCGLWCQNPIGAGDQSKEINPTGLRDRFEARRDLLSCFVCIQPQREEGEVSNECMRTQ